MCPAVAAAVTEPSLYGSPPHENVLKWKAIFVSGAGPIETASIVLLIITIPEPPLPLDPREPAPPPLPVLAVPLPPA